MYHERLATFLKRLDRLRLPAEGFAIYRDHGEGDFTNLENRQMGIAGAFRKPGKEPYQSRERKFEHQQIRRLLVSSYLLQRQSARPIAPLFARSWFIICPANIVSKVTSYYDP